MKNLLIITSIILCTNLVLGQQRSKESVNGQILGDTNNVTIIKVWGTSYERSYAQGYLQADDIIETLNWISTQFGPYYQTARNLITDGQTFFIDTIYQSMAQGLIDGMNDAGVDTTICDYVDVLVGNSFFDISGFFGKSSDMNCSALMSWGEATDGTDLNESAVITRHFDWAEYSEE